VEIKAIAHVGRFKDIVVTLFRYGFDEVIERLNPPGKILFEKISRVDGELNTWKRLRLMIEELGPTFIKIGQILSLRPDLIPPPLLIELQKLQDSVAPEPFDAIRGVIETSLGKTLEENFSYFDAQPLAGASLSQVHRAVLREQRTVVAVKVQRPLIRQKIDTDIAILEHIAQQLHGHMEVVAPYDLPALVREIKKVLRLEIDFTREARHMQIAGNALAEDPNVSIPKVFGDFSTSRVLTMELIVGIKIKDLTGQKGGKPEALARNGLRLTIKQIFEDGFFHADPHPGNVLVTPGNVFCLLDWGMVGRLTPAVRLQLVDLIEAAIDKDSERLMEMILSIVKPMGEVDQQRLEKDLLAILDIHHSLALNEINIGSLLLEISGIIHENRLRLPADLAIMIKALITAEGTARSLYPELNVVREAEPYIKRLSLSRWKPHTMWRNFVHSLRQFTALQRNLPDRLNRILEHLDSGRLLIRFKHENLDELSNTLENISNRLTFGIIIGALIIGSSMIITTGVKPLLFGYPAFGIIGYLVSGLLGLWLVFNMIRSRKL
jgi:ubiquinone biosynthesis protein